MTSAAIKMRVQLSLQDPVSIPFGYIPTSGIVVSGSGSFSKYAVLCGVALSCSVMSDSATPWTVAHQAPLSMGILQAKILEWVAMPSSRGSSQLGIEPRSPTLQADSLQAEPPEKPRTRVGTPNDPIFSKLSR